MIVDFGPNFRTSVLEVLFIKRKMTKELLDKYLNNCCTSKEVEEVVQWIKGESFLKESKNFGRNDWGQLKDNDNIITDEKLDKLLDKIHHRLNIEEQHTTHIKNTRFINQVLKAAAVILIPILSFLFYTVSENYKLSNQIAILSVDSLEVIAPVGARAVVELSDGSVVHLNYGSRIKYPQHFMGESRSVSLTGEAYFEVARNPNKPFVVSVGHLNIRAVGTAFNVNAFAENEDIATTLVEGKVVLEEVNNNGTIKPIVELIPGQHTEYEKSTGSINSDHGGVEKYIAWKEGRLVFENEPIAQVAQRLSRIFNVDIQVTPEVTNYKYTVTFIDEPLFQILDLLSTATPISFRTLPRQKKSDGTFSKQKILIERKK